MQNVTIEKLFELMGHDYNKMGVDEPVDVTTMGYEVLSYDERTEEKKFALIKKIVRKQETDAYHVSYNNLIVSPMHRFFARIASSNPAWVEAHALADCENVELLTENSGWQRSIIERLSNEKTDILDIEVDETHCYFSNGVLSHNTMYGDPTVVPGGKAIPFHASVRIKLGAGAHVLNKDKEAIGINVSAKTMKNKLSPPFRTCNFQIIFGVGIREHEEIFDFLRPHGMTDVIVDGKQYSVGVEGTGAWKEFSVRDKSGVEIHTKKFYKPQFDEIMTDQTYAPFIDALLETHMVRKMRDPEGAEIDDEALVEIQAVAQELTPDDGYRDE